MFLDGTCIRAHQKAAGAKGATRHAFGRSRGSFGTTAYVIRNAKGRPLGFVPLPGQTAELKAAPRLLAESKLRPDQVVYDRAYSSGDWRNRIRALGAEPVVPVNPTHPAATYDHKA